MVLKGSRRAGSGRLLRWREELDECLGERLGMGQVEACPAPGISCTRALGTWSATCRALAVKMGLVSYPSSSSTGAIAGARAVPPGRADRGCQAAVGNR